MTLFSVQFFLTYCVKLFETFSIKLTVQSEKKLILLFDLFTYLLSQLCFKLCLLNVLYNLNNQIPSILITRSYNRVMIRHNCRTYVSIIPNFIFGFWSLLATIYMNILVYILQGKMSKTKKENHATAVTKIPKTKQRKYGMNETMVNMALK